MEKIPSSLLGYDKKTVDNILKEKNSKLNCQQNDIEYLRSEITKLEKRLFKQKNSSENELEK